MSADGALFRFGVVADVQYADKDTGSNFSKTVTRYYRPSLDALRRTVARWAAAREGGQQGPSFVLDLGDLIDCTSPAPDADLAAALGAYAALPDGVARHHLIGNHEVRCWSLADLAAKGFGRDGRHYYSFSPAAGWRIVVLNSVEQSVLCPGCTSFKDKPEGNAGYDAARALLVDNNPNLAGGEATWYSGVNWAKGHDGDTPSKYMPYNGALGAEQREWLRSELQQARAQQQRVIIAGHIPVHPDAAPRFPKRYPAGYCPGELAILLDNEEVLQIIRDAGCVAAVLSGHHHPGGAASADGVAHVTLQSSQEADPEQHTESAATVTVYPDRIVIDGHGAQESSEIALR